MADVSDPEIQNAYEEVRSDKSAINWLIIDYTTDKSDKLSLTETGEGGLNELKEKFMEGKASFGYVRVDYANDKESQRSKFVFVIWIGDGVKVMRKAKLSVHTADVKQVLRQFSIEVAASSKEDLEESPIVTRLRKAGGASYDRT